MKRQIQKVSVLLLMMNLLHVENVFAVPKLIPVVNGQLTLGQWYFDGDSSSLGGNAALNVIPAIRYTNRLTLIPSFSTFYRGTRSTEELAGGNTLFQDTWENGVNVKLVHGLSEHLKVRENVGARIKWYRETRDENWNKGLYDYRVLNAGAEVEYSWSKRTSLALGYDLSQLTFPNYESLESSQSPDNAREYASENPLDQLIHLITMRLNIPIGRNLTTGVQAFLSPRSYDSQTIVENTGELSPDKRSDLFVGGTVSLERPYRISSTTRFIPTVFYGYGALNSNQNHYDASVTKFIPDFYDYDQQRMGTQMTYLFGSNPAGPMTIDASYVYTSRNYRSRVIQSVDGDYQDEKLNISDTQFNLGFSYPMNRNFRLRANTSFGRSTSNNKFEEIYKYNYSTANYQFGVSYEY